MPHEREKQGHSPILLNFTGKWGVFLVFTLQWDGKYRRGVHKTFY